MSQRNLHRLYVLQLVLNDQLSLRDAASALGVSYRQVRRLKALVVTEGAAGLLHHNRGRAPANRLPAAMAAGVARLARTTYAMCNDTYCAELLEEREGIIVSRATVRRLRRADGQAPKRPRRAPKARRRRERKAAAGRMVLWDGSPHAWFGPEHPVCCLMAAIDDATSQVVAGHFLPHESSAGYLNLLYEMAVTVGLPHNVYQDQHSALRRNDDHWSLQEQLQGRQEPTQVGRILEVLDIIPIFARSPQAKGRVERLFGTLQDRLVAWLALHGITTIEAANAALPAFFAAFNARFAVPAADATPVWRPLPAEMDLERTLAFVYPATVGNDHIVRCGGERFSVPARKGGQSRAKARVQVYQLLDGRWRVYEDDELLAETPATDLGEPLRTRYRRKTIPITEDAQWEPGPPFEPFWDTSPEEVEAAILRQHTRPGHGLEATRIA